MFHRDSFGKTLVALIMAITLGALLISPLWVSAQGTDPESVIRAIIDALNAKNMDAALAFVTDETVITLIPPPPDTTGVFTGKEEIRGWWEGWVAGNGYAELSDFQVAGDKATWSAKVSEDFFKGLGVDPLDFTGEGIVQGGLVKSYTFTITDESLKKLEAAMPAPAEALPETGIPIASGGLLPAHALAMALGGLAVLGALGLALLRRRVHPQP